MWSTMADRSLVFRLLFIFSRCFRTRAFSPISYVPLQRNVPWLHFLAGFLALFMLFLSLCRERDVFFHTKNALHTPSKHLFLYFKFIQTLTQKNGWKTHGQKKVKWRIIPRTVEANLVPCLRWNKPEFIILATVESASRNSSLLLRLNVKYALRASSAPDQTRLNEMLRKMHTIEPWLFGAREAELRIQIWITCGCVQLRSNLHKPVSIRVIKRVC